MKELLKISHVTKYYGGRAVVTKALDGVSLSVEQREFTAVMGPSGSGKSTLLNVVSTIDQVSSGEIWVEGENISRMKENALAAFRRDRLGFIFQDYNLLDTLTVEENILLPLNLRRESFQSSQEKLHRMARAFGLSDELKKFPAELSGGQKQRAACARAIITDPALILADEPTGALDSGNARGLMQTLDMMNQKLGSTILMVTHDPVAASYAGRVLFLKDGKIWCEILRGERSRQELHREILAATVALGGDADVR